MMKLWARLWIRDGVPVLELRCDENMEALRSCVFETINMHESAGYLYLYGREVKDGGQIESPSEETAREASGEKAFPVHLL